MAVLAVDTLLRGTVERELVDIEPAERRVKKEE